MSSLTQKLARFGVNLSLDKIPLNDIHHAKLLTLDLIGVAIAGLETIEAKSALNACRILGGENGPSSLWGTGVMSAPGTAALFNGICAHALELDDFMGIDHSGAVIVPALLSAADCEGVIEGDRFIEGMIFGYEVGRRILDGAGGYRLHNRRGWHTTGTLGSFAAAAAVSKFLGLAENNIVWALGLAGSFTGGTWAFNKEGAMSKRYHAGIAAETGLKAAYLAREGFTGPISILEAEWGGYFNLYGSGLTPETDELADKLGEDLRINWTGIKIYACCRGIHSAIDVALEFRNKHKLGAEKIESITVNCTPVQKAQLGRVLPSTRLEAQFSLPYSVAVALIHGEASYDYFTSKWINDTAIRKLAKKVKMLSIDQRPLDEEPELCVRTKDGRNITGKVQYALGHPANPVSEQDIFNKYMYLATRQIDSNSASILKDLVLKIDQPKQLSKLRELLSEKWDQGSDHGK